MNQQQEADLDLHPVAEVSTVVDTVPVIDIGGLIHNGHIDPRHGAVQQIADAARRWGFFQIVNHEVPSADFAEVWSETQRLFQKPSAEKETLLRTLDNPWGYYNNELTKNQRDKKEVFDFTDADPDPIYHSANRWPIADEEFKQLMLNHQQACTQISLCLLQAFCVGLDLPANYLQNEFSPGHTGFTRLNYYPVQDPMADSSHSYQPTADLGVHHHTDAGALTILLQDSIGGLQVHHDDQWHNVPVVENAFVINTGDMMQVWSNDLYRAAIHRVLAMDTKDRYSVPFFFNPSARTTVEPLPSTVNENKPSHYRPIDWAEFRSKRTDGDYANYGGEVQISQYLI
jgi:isopenicillin N synthase-like dioxygenase